MFKYLDIDGARKTPTGRAVKFSRPLDFNDPFDIQLEELLGVSFAEFSSDLSGAMFDFICGEIDCGALVNKRWTPDIIRMNRAFRKATAQQRAEMKKELMATQFDELYNAEHMEELRKKTLADMRGLLDDYGVFCTSLRRDSLLMWAHYAAKHTGVVLHFVPNVEEDSVFLLSKPVTYSKERPLVFRTAEEMVRHAFLVTDENSSAAMRDRLVFTKSAEWSYEEELRLAQPGLIDDAKPFALVPFWPNELTEVYFGCRISSADRGEIATLAKAVNPNVTLYQAKTDKREYALEFVQTG